MRSKASVKPSLYPPIPFHVIRTIALLSTLIVGIILAVFIYHLHQSNHKLPWVFLVVCTPTTIIPQLKSRGGRKRKKKANECS